MSENRRRINLRTVGVGLLLQVALALVVLWTDAGRWVFDTLGSVFSAILAWSMKGAVFVFGGQLSSGTGAVGFVLAVQLFAIIIFMGAVTRMLYYLGVLQWVVRGMAWVMRRVMRASGAESLATASNVFVGMVESALVVRPYVGKMTRSELFTIMTAGLATVAGRVMALYIAKVESFLDTAAAGQLLTARVMSAPAAILIAKILIPETEQSVTADVGAAPVAEEPDSKPTNLMDAAVRGSLDGMQLAVSVMALLVAFVALVAMANGILGGVTGFVARNVFESDFVLTFDSLLGYLCAPFAAAMGIPWEDAFQAGALIGKKTVLNEYVAYDALAGIMQTEGTRLAPRSALFMSYALCGFANFGSLGIMIAGIGGIAPGQRPRLARLGLLSIVAGSLAAFMTACLAGLLGSVPA
jgi:CNT family concentrative nucleoside transporter